MSIVFRRIVAFIIDCSVLGLYAIILFAFSPALRPLFLQSANMSESAGFLLLTLPFGLYFTMSESSKWSASIGKKLMKLRVVDAKGSGQIHFSQSLLRSAVKFLPWELAHFAIWHAFVFASNLQNIAMGVLAASYILMFTYFIGLVRKPHRTMYDRISNTKVI